MSRSPVHIILSLFCILAGMIASAQNTTRIQVKADRNAILIGEPINLSLQADIPENEPIRFFRIDTLQHFEILDRSKIDTFNTCSGTVLRQSIRAAR
jgi:hypothetical protein